MAAARATIGIGIAGRSCPHEGGRSGRILPPKPEAHMSNEDEQTYHFGRRTDRTYTSAPFANGQLKYVTKVIDSPEASHFAPVESEIVLRRTDVQRKEIKAVVTV